MNAISYMKLSPLERQVKIEPTACRRAKLRTRISPRALERSLNNHPKTFKLLFINLFKPRTPPYKAEILRNTPQNNRFSTQQISLGQKSLLLKLGLDKFRKGLKSKDNGNQYEAKIILGSQHIRQIQEDDNGF